MLWKFFNSAFFSEYNILGIFLNNEKLESIYSKPMSIKCIFLRNYLMSHLENYVAEIWD